MYQNPIVYADYSDPDVIRVGEDYYMVASSFTYLPGVPILHSRDLVHWEIINYAVKSLPFARYDRPCHGSGTWAPSIRYHEGTFFIFIPLPDEGIFVARSRDIYGEFALNCIRETKGWIDPCPFWDGDGRAYMVFAYANSRCGKKHRLSLIEIDPDCRHTIGQEQVIFHREDIAPTIEGPKLYKRDGKYLILAPAGGVATGWQAALRSENIWGPYEYRVVLEQGKTPVNGPHQGGLVDTPNGENWFLHFQDVGALGRILHLQPVKFRDGWPVMGDRGQPVSSSPLPVEGQPHYEIAASDDFAGEKLGLQWQFQANPKPEYYELTENGLRLRCMANPTRENYLWYAPNALTQIPQGKSFYAQVTVTLENAEIGDFAALGTVGHSYGYMALCRTSAGYALGLYAGEVEEIQNEGRATEKLLTQIPLSTNSARLAFSLDKGEMLTFYDHIGSPIPHKIPFKQATWTGGKIVLWSGNRENRASQGWGSYKDYIFTPKEQL